MFAFFDGKPRPEVGEAGLFFTLCFEQGCSDLNTAGGDLELVLQRVRRP